MPTLKEIRNRINSVRTTRQTTSAMKLVAAAKLHKAQDRIIRLRPYAAAMQKILSQVASSGTHSTGIAASRETKRVLLVVITSNKGLCGALNGNTVKHALHLAESEYRTAWEQGQVSFLAFGEKGREMLQKRHVPLLDTEVEFNDHFNASFSAGVADQLMKMYVSGATDRVVLVYNRFKNAATQLLDHECILPVSQPVQTEVADPVPDDGMYIFEPGRQAIADELQPDVLRLKVHCAFCEAAASEQGSRLTAMHQATDNADSLIEALSLQYNKARQSAITNQLVEIVSSTEAQQ